jgi:sugar phosphate isomerase/epimerase
MSKYPLSRRSFLGLVAAVPVAAAQPLSRAISGSLSAFPPDSKQVPIGLELYSVREELAKDLTGTVAAVAKIGYQCVEFYAPYYSWTPDYAKQVRKQLDDLGVRCYSTHNDLRSFKPAGIGNAIDLNHILGTKYVVLAHPGNVSGVDGWKAVAGLLNQANTALAAEGLHAGYHNHDTEWRPVDGERPMDLLAAGTDKSIMLQFDVGTCLEAGADPVAWINQNPGRIRSMHLKDWSKENGYKVLFGEGVAPWKQLFAAGESVGGVEYYLIEQEGSRYPELETAERCLAAYRKLRA